jgi:hypothetical protein
MHLRDGTAEALLLSGHRYRHRRGAHELYTSGCAVFRVRVLIPLGGLLLAVSALIVVSAGVFVERVLDADACDERADSTPGGAEWSWFPPGVRCTYPSDLNPDYVIVEDPPLARVGEILLAVGLAGVSSYFLVSERHSRKSS